MRVLLVVLALVATPFLAGVSQSSQGSNCNNGQGDEHRSAQGTANAHRGACVAPDPAPAPACKVNAPSGVTITGTLYNASTGGALAGWCVELSGTVNATAATDASGNYVFSDLPQDGTYQVCEVILNSTWHEVAPTLAWGGTSCANGTVGWSFPLSGGNSASFNNFWNAQ